MRYQIEMNNLVKKDIDFMNKYCSKERKGEVTQATEKRVNKIIRNGGAYSELIENIWESVKYNHSLYRDYQTVLKDCKSIVKRFKKLGATIPNKYLQFRVPLEFLPIANGLTLATGYKFNYQGRDAITRYSFVDIEDFNELIKLVYAIEFGNKY